MKMAARVSDLHVCPMSDAGKPHLGGVIATGAPTVLAEYLPAARVGDMAVCPGPPNAISTGSSSVIICYSFAARVGDSTAHGGVISLGAPTVLIGD